MHFAAEHRVHHPLIQIAAANAGDGAVVLHAKNELAATEIRQSDDLLRKPFRALLIALELDAGVFAVGDQCEQFQPGHQQARRPVVRA